MTAAIITSAILFLLAATTLLYFMGPSKTEFKALESWRRAGGDMKDLWWDPTERKWVLKKYNGESGRYVFDPVRKVFRREGDW